MSQITGCILHLIEKGCVLHRAKDLKWGHNKYDNLVLKIMAAEWAFRQPSYKPIIRGGLVNLFDVNATRPEPACLMFSMLFDLT
jgi:hypothetical protein